MTAIDMYNLNVLFYVYIVAVQYLKTPNSLFKINLKTIFIELQNYFQTQMTQISN